MSKTNGATHFLFASTLVLDANSIVGDFEGVLSLSATTIQDEVIPAGTRIEMRCESRLREPCPCLGADVIGVMLKAG